MLSRIRLAERRGLLTGKRLSRVQTRSLEVLMVVEAQEKHEAWSREAKLALVGHDPKHFAPLLFPDWFPAKVIEVGEEDGIPEGGQYVFEDAGFTTAEEAEAILASMVADGSGVYTLDDSENW